MRRNLAQWRAAKLAGIAALLSLAACAHAPPPTSQLAVSDAAVNDAQAAGAAEFAPVELRSAQDKLARAQAALREERNDEARRYAEAAEVDANLAETRAQSAKAQDAAAEVRSSIGALRNELNRNNSR